jgi:plastocyanin
MRTLLCVGFLVAATVLSGCSGAAGPVTPSKDDQGRYVINIGPGFHFVPNDAIVPAGAVVIWKNVDQTPHDVTPDDAAAGWGSDGVGNIQPGGSYNHTFSQGVYKYHCALHGQSLMSGTLTVSAATASSS